MTAPNLINASNITGKTELSDVTIQSTVLLSNANGSNKVLKLNSLYVSNNLNIGDCRITVEFVRAGQETRIVTNSLVPVENTLIVISKEASIYLEEGDSLKISGSQNDALQAVISYEIIE